MPHNTKRGAADLPRLFFVIVYTRKAHTMTTEELQKKREEYVAMVERLEEQLADPFSSRSISSGGGSKSASSPGADIEQRIKYFRRRIADIDAALGTAPAPGTPATVEVRFDA